MNVYIVMGTSGAYSDRTEWAVAAYHTRELADKHEWAAKRWADAHRRELYKDPKLLSPWDPDIHQIYDDGVDYFVLEVPLRTELPEVGS